MAKGKLFPAGPVRGVLFDFDGVILESADIKTRAFRDLFKRYPRFVGRIVRYHLAHAGISRYEKFDHIYRNILRRPLAASERRRLGRRFSKLVLRKVLACPFVPGARQVLTRLHRRMPLFVISGTPERELRLIVRRRGLARYFRGVYGSPRSKPALIAFLLRKFGLPPRGMLYVGDARSDWRAARRRRVAFVGRVPAGGRSPFPRGTPRVRDLHGLAQFNGTLGRGAGL